jgi:hypothetical protein
MNHEHIQPKGHQEGEKKKRKKRKNIKPSHDTLKDPQTPCNPPPQNREDKEAVKMTIPRNKQKGKRSKKQHAYLAEEEYFVTALVPSETACFANSPGRMSRTLGKRISVIRIVDQGFTHEVWISLDEMVDFLL